MDHFIEEMRRMLDPPDDAVILRWLDLAENLSENSEWGIGFKTELRAIFLALKYVQHNFSAEVLQKSLRLCILNDEIINGAVCFNAGYSAAEVQAFANDGILSGGYIPSEEDEVGKLILVEMAESEMSLLLVQNGSKFLPQSISGLYRLAELKKLPVSRASLEQVLGDRVVDKVENKILRNAYCKAFESATAIGTFVKCWLSRPEIVTINCPNLFSLKESGGWLSEEQDIGEEIKIN